MHTKIINFIKINYFGNLITFYRFTSNKLLKSLKCYYCLKRM